MKRPTAITTSDPRSWILRLCLDFCARIAIARLLWNGEAQRGEKRTVSSRTLLSLSLFLFLSLAQFALESSNTENPNVPPYPLLSHDAYCLSDCAATGIMNERLYLCARNARTWKRLSPSWYVHPERQDN